MVGYEQIEKIVKGYFDNAVIIDDQLKIGEENSSPDFGDIDDSAFDEIVATSEDVLEASYEAVHAASEIATVYSETSATLSTLTETSPILERPNQAFEQLIEEGFVTFPFRFQRGKSNVNSLTNILNNTKLLIIDWNLEGSHDPGLRGDTAIQFLNSFTKSKKTLKCAVIYTQEPDLVLAKLKLHFQVKEDEEFLFFEEKDSSQGNSLFGFVMNKNVDPQQIVEQICKVLYKNKSLVIHLMDSSNRLEMNLSRALREFNHSFENMIFTQILTSNVPGHQVPEFIDNILLSSVINDFSDEVSPSYLFLVKKSNLLLSIKRHGGFDEGKVSQLISLLKIKGISKDKIENLLRKPEFVTSLQETLSQPEIDTLDKFESKLTTLCDPYLQGDDRDKLKTIQKFFALFLILWETYINKGEDSFKASYSQELCRFTKLMKYVDYVDKHIQTGTIIRTRKGKYLLCITPFCDVHEPSKIKNKYKFLVGEVVQLPEKESNLLKNTSDNCYYTALPNLDNNTVGFIRWDFYKVCSITLQKDQLSAIGQPLLNLKKDYIQKIMNRYLSYQSRAGVNEMFYKESIYIDNFFKLIQ